MKFAVDFPNFGAFGDPQRFAAVARLAEESGWDGLFIWDHINRPYHVKAYDPWIALAAAAMETERIRIGTMITPLARRRPWVLARQTVSLDHLSRGRFILGAGLGSPGGREVEWEAFGEELDLRRRAKMLDEGLAIIAGLWSGEPFEFQGECYQVARSQFVPAPLQRPRIPIWIGGTWPNKAPFRRAAKWDGVIPDLDRASGKRIETFQEAVSFTSRLHKGERALEAVFIADPIPAASRGEQVAAAQEAQNAGATWWLADLSPTKFGGAWAEPWPDTLMLGYVKKGPPRSR